MVVFDKPNALTKAPLHYCPGCTHGIIHRLVAESLEELGVTGRTIGVASVGCSVFTYNYFNCDMVQAAHGRAPAVATGVKRSDKNNIVFTYQGDGDLAAIGTAETVHSAARGENITVIFVNNAIYGMTGGQMAPTTLPGQKTQTSPYGRDVEAVGYPIKVCEMLSNVDGATYLERVAVNNVANVKKAKAAIKKAFQNQIEGKGFSLVEVLSTCPTNWGLSPEKAIGWLEENMLPYYPLGVYKDKYGVRTMSNEILIAGFGGQGILFSGKFLAYEGLIDGKEVSWLPSYGPEMRGGTANCSVIISDTPIGSPIVANPDIMIAMNLPSLDKYEKETKKGGKIFVDSSLIERKVERTDVDVFYIPASQMASDENLPGLANMIMIGHMIKKSGIIPEENIEKAMKKVVPPTKQNMFDLNMKAVKLGFDY